MRYNFWKNNRTILKKSKKNIAQIKLFTNNRNQIDN